MIKNNYQIIKRIVEVKSNNKDLSIKGCADGLVLYRCIYYKLCKDYLKKQYNHTSASKEINRDHNNSRYALMNFNELKDQKFFHTYIDLYNECNIVLKEIEKEINNIIKCINYKKRKETI